MVETVTAYDINTGNKKQMAEAIQKLAQGEQSSFFTDEGNFAILIKGEIGAELRVAQEEKPYWDIVIYYGEDGSIEGEGVKRSIINKDVVEDIDHQKEARAKQVTEEENISYNKALSIVATRHRTSVSKLKKVLSTNFLNS